MVSLFGLFLRCASLMEPWPKLVRSVLLVNGFIQFYWFYRFYVSLGDIWCCLVYSIHRLVTCSYHLISYMFPAWYRIIVSLLAPACWYSRHGFQCIFMTWIYQYTCAYLSTPSGFRITTRRGVLTPLDPHVQVLEAWSVWILPVADQSGAAEAWTPSRPSRVASFQASLLGSRVFLLWPLCNSGCMCLDYDDMR